MTPEEYLTYDAISLAELVRTKKASPRELLDASLAVIDRHDPTAKAEQSRNHRVAWGTMHGAT